MNNRLIFIFAAFVCLSLAKTSVGTCNERFAKCGVQDQGLDNVTQSNKDTICNTANTGLSCFDFVKNDPYCISEKNAYTTEEQDLKRLINLVCGGGKADSSLVLLSFSLLVAVLMVGGKKYF